MDQIGIRDRSADYYKERVDREVAQHLAVAPYTARQKFALTCQILGAEGHGSGIITQMTAKAERPGTFLTMRFGAGFEDVTARDLLLVDSDLKTIEGDGMANPAQRFQMWVYDKRPDVNCIVHAHSPFVSAYSMLDEPFHIAHMDASFFSEDIAWLREWPGLPIGDDEGRLISEALGAKRAILLAHHGYLVAARTIEEAAVLAIYMERNARTLLLAKAAGRVRAVEPNIAKSAHDFMLGAPFVGGTFNYFARRVLETAPTCIADA
jgi:L-fuculose-phosphate aldolase